MQMPWYVYRAIGHQRTLDDKAYLCEIAVGRGRLLVCAMRLAEALAAGDPAARYLQAAMLAYLARPRLAPAPIANIF